MAITIICERSDAFAGISHLPKDEKRKLGSFEWVQLTYDTLHVAPDGDQIASFNPENGAWMLEADGSLWSGLVISAT